MSDSFDRPVGASLRPDLEQAGEDPRVLDGIDFASDAADLSALSDSSLAFAISRLFAEIAIIRDQLANRKVDDPTWQTRARTALLYRTGKLGILRAEHSLRQRRLKAAPTPVRAPSRPSDTVAARQAAKQARKLERIKANAARSETRATLFTAYFHATLTKEDYFALWDKVREMFPDHPAWPLMEDWREGAPNEERI